MLRSRKPFVLTAGKLFVMSLECYKEVSKNDLDHTTSFWERFLKFLFFSRCFSGSSKLWDTSRYSRLSNQAHDYFINGFRTKHCNEISRNVIFRSNIDKFRWYALIFTIFHGLSIKMKNNKIKFIYNKCSPAARCLNFFSRFLRERKVLSTWKIT